MTSLDDIRAGVAAAGRRDRKLVEQIAQFLADQNNDDVCRFYTDQADEIMALVREDDRKALRAAHGLAS